MNPTALIVAAGLTLIGAPASGQAVPLLPGSSAPLPAVVQGQKVVTVSTIADLADVGSQLARVAVVQDDGGRNGTFVFQFGDFSAAVADDPQAGLHVAADDRPSSQGAWVRQGAEEPDARWFGASPEATPADNAVALQAWLDMLVLRQTTGHLPAGTYRYDTGLHIDGSATGVRGDGRGVSILDYTPTSGNALTIDSGSGTTVEDVHLRDLSIQGPGALVSGAGLALVETVGVVVERTTLSGHHTGVLVDGSQDYSLLDAQISDTTHGVDVVGGGGADASLHGHLERVVVEGAIFGFLIQDASDLSLHGCEARACFDGFRAAPLSPAHRVEHLFFVDCLADGSTGTGVVLLTDPGEVIWRVSWIGGKVSNGTFDGFLFTGATHESVVLSGVQIDNNGHHGISARQVSDLLIADCKVLGNSTAAPGVFGGIELGASGTGGVNGAVIQGNRSGTGAGYPNPQGFGIFLHNFNTRLLITGNDLLGNAQAGINTTSAASSLIKDNL